MRRHNNILIILALVAVIGALSETDRVIAQINAQESVEENQQDTAFKGMDEIVNEGLAEQAGVPSRDPFINIEAMGELWNLLLLLGGGVCGFILGRQY